MHGIQLTRGPHAGRLVLSVNTETWDGSRVSANHAALVVSDDGGEHWSVGASGSWPVAADGTFRQKPSEMTLAELAVGSVLVSGREQDGSATTGEQPLLWMGGIGTTQPQVWLRAEPSNDRVQGLITVRDGASAPRTASVRTTGAHNDGLWHHVALRRGGGRLTLFLDGAAIGTADVPGSVSRNSPFGVHIGQRMDSRAFFTGAIDDVHVWDRALSDEELATGAAPSGNTVLWLPMDRTSRSH